MWKRMISGIIGISMIFGAAFPVLATEADNSAADRETVEKEMVDKAAVDKTAVDKGAYALAIDEETCTVLVLDASGAVVLSTNPTAPQEDEYTPGSALNNVRSQLVVSYYDSKNVDSTIGSYLSSVKQNTFTITKEENKIRVDYDFSRKNEQFKIPVEYRLTGDRFQVTVCTDEIEEYGEKKIHKISLVPYMVRGTAEEEGYLLLPDGSGAKVDFSYINPYASAYSGQIYGKNVGEALYYEEGNTQQVILPVFGADYGDHGILAKVDGNAPAGYIEAECAGRGSSYAHAYAAFVYRIFDVVTIAGHDWRYKEYVAESEVTEQEDFSVSYYITKQGGLMSLAEKCREITENLPDAPRSPLTGALYAYGATTQRASFLGIPYTKTLKATTFDDIVGMLSGFTEGNSSLAVFLQDFDKASLAKKYPSGIKWSKYSGGAGDFKSLLAEYGNAHSFYCVQNVLYENSGSFMWAKQNKYAKMVSKELLSRYTYSPVTYAGTKTDWYGLKLSNFRKMADKALKKAEGTGCGVALQYLGDELYGDYSKSGGASRNEFVREIAGMLETHSTSGSLAVDGGNAYALGYADVYYNFPVSSSSFHMETGSVPFVQLVYHGGINMVSSAINMADDPGRELLRCVESGTVPCFAVTGMTNDALRRSNYKDLFDTCFAQQKEEIAGFFSRTEGYYNKIYDQRIASYECREGVSVTVYENGVTAVVNASDHTAVYQGRQIAPMDFAIWD